MHFAVGIKPFPEKIQNCYTKNTRITWSTLCLIMYGCVLHEADVVTMSYEFCRALRNRTAICHSEYIMNPTKCAILAPAICDIYKWYYSPNKFQIYFVYILYMKKIGRLMLAPGYGSYIASSVISKFSKTQKSIFYNMLFHPQHIYYHQKVIFHVIVWTLWGNDMSKWCCWL